LACGTLYHFRVVATNGSAASGADQTFTTATCPPPTVSTLAATNVTSNGATLNGTVNPNGTSTTAAFEYGLTTSYGSIVPATPAPGSGTAPIAVSASVTGLSCNTQYHFRAVGTNASTANGPDQSFTTATCSAPTVVTLPATNVTTMTATLNGTVNPNGASATATFEYGLTTSYGTVVSATPAPGSGTTPIAVSASVTGLSCNTLYHFRAVATNASTANGADQTFRTTFCSTFTDDPLVPGSTAIKAVHFIEIRSRIDALRVRLGLPAFSWTDVDLRGVWVRIQHLVELRQALRDAYLAAAVAPPVYTDSAATMMIRAVHITELRAAVVTIEQILQSRAASVEP
jgi:hypothetical protein